MMVPFSRDEKLPERLVGTKLSPVFGKAAPCPGGRFSLFTLGKASGFEGRESLEATPWVPGNDSPSCFDMALPFRGDIPLQRLKIVDFSCQKVLKLDPEKSISIKGTRHMHPWWCFRGVIY